MQSFEFADYFEKRIKELGLTRTEVAKRAGVSRQALNDLTTGKTGQAKVSTVVSIAQVLKVHPIHLFRLLLSRVEFPKHTVTGAKYRGDAVGFIADVTIPDNSRVMVDQVFTKTWEIQHIGDKRWLQRRYICVDEPVEYLSIDGRFAPPTTQRGLMPTQPFIDIPELLPGQIVQLSVEFTAPPYPCSVFSYWKMIDAQGDFCFPETEGLSCHVQVVAL